MLNMWKNLRENLCENCVKFLKMVDNFFQFFLIMCKKWLSHIVLHVFSSIVSTNFLEGFNLFRRDFCTVST